MINRRRNKRSLHLGWRHEGHKLRSTRSILHGSLLTSRLLFGVPANVNGGLARLLKRLICTNLYLRFLYTRRRKIRKLGTTLRGGAAQLPLYILGVVLNPRASMGLGEEISLPENLQTILGL